MEAFIVRFACARGDEPANFLLDGKKYDDWVVGEPPEGYACFKVLWMGDLSGASISPGSVSWLDERTGRA